MNENPVPESIPSGAEEDDARLAEARRALQELTESEGADGLAPAERLADLLEGLLEGQRGEAS
ncbi:MAG: hypothetical protein F4Z41_06720 [Acidimicrobiia bacterium]|nr:hypothetical protein [bacterium]MXX01901.1 hypothetical protein [Acidimicrobiia bacterium]MXX45883.1 hypothetical protein [Acidimicrobiia bacterium]MXY74578.1 hypothetical protein [Acidimicrobiia bacterium]MYA38322.1 hypothetical protein [Acidimicrobiia bacterium]